tara:strand:+ start:279 stop:3026 length:2748 start_codon:yes stop_codon:yes gene_type:complete
MATPLKIKDGSGNIQEMTTSDENYIAYQMGLHLAGAGTTEPGSLNKAASGTAVGSYDNTFFNEPVGTHPSTSISTGTTTTNIHQTTGTAAETNANIKTPLQWVDAGGETGFKTMPSAALDAAVDRYLSTIFTGEYPGSYRIATAAPSSDWSIAINSAVTDTRTDGTSVPYHIYKRQTMTAPATKRPLYDRDGDGQNLKAMSDDQIKWSFGQRAKTRMSSTAIGTFQLRNSSQGAPTDTGTWVAKGVALDTKQTTSQGNFQTTSTVSFNTTYTRGYENAFSTNYISTTDVDYQSIKGINYTNTYEGSFATSQVENFDAPYVSSYTADYVGNYTTAYTGDYNQVYLGTYDNTFTTDYQSTSNIDYIGTYSGAFNATYTTAYDISFATNYTTTYTGVFSAAYNKDVSYDGPNPFATLYTTDYGIRYSSEFQNNYSNVYQQTYTGLYTRDYVSTIGYQLTLYYIGTYDTNYQANLDYVGVGTFLGSNSNYANDYVSQGSVYYTGIHFYNWGVASAYFSNSGTLWLPALGNANGMTFANTSTNEHYDGQPESDAGNRWDFYAYWDGIRDIAIGMTAVPAQWAPVPRAVKISQGSEGPDAGAAFHPTAAPSSNWVARTYVAEYRYSNSVRTTPYFQQMGYYMGYYQGSSFYASVSDTTFTGYYINPIYVSSQTFQTFPVYTQVYDGASFTVDIVYSKFVYFATGFQGDYIADYLIDYQVFYEGGYDNTSITLSPANIPYQESYVTNYDTLYNRVDDYSTDYSTDFNANYTTDYVSTFTADYINTYEGAFDGVAYNTIYTGNYVTNYDNSFETSFAIDYEGATFNATYDRDFTTNYDTLYVNTYTGLYTSEYIGAFDQAYTTDYTGNYVSTYTGDYTATYDIVFEAGYIKDYIADYIGDFSGLQIDATSETNETYTLYVRIS